jgi:hypothetical protein
MKFANWITVAALGICLISANPAMTCGQENGNGHGKGHEKHGDDDEQSEHYYQHHSDEAARDWYSQNERYLPAGLAKKINYLQGWKNSLYGGVRSLRGSKNACSPVLWN